MALRNSWSSCVACSTIVMYFNLKIKLNRIGWEKSYKAGTVCSAIPTGFRPITRRHKIKEAANKWLFCKENMAAAP
ncbi:hypothetical protein J7426_15300 [Tropicibacter sp. R16_0]|uniref:hypothetical protein n=1 Tax=Tropicibacter sp. R16_0 TaxID=2821102 RepID=UPI001ADCD604|nr:hypothetical protein [Tropicibacter sp. R16_0]MBO9451639.1 hypothetical protein [Tropicibacter sp. R16_0]